MIKKYAILTLILSLITTQSYGIFDKETILQKINDIKNMWSSCRYLFVSYAEETKEKNHKASFKEYNVENYFAKLNKPSVEKFQNQSNEEKQETCRATFKTISNKQTFDVSFDKLYDEILSIIIEKKHERYRAIEAVFYSENPDIKEIVGLASLDKRDSKSCTRCSFNFLYYPYYFFNQVAMCEQEGFLPTIKD